MPTTTAILLPRLLLSPSPKPPKPSTKLSKKPSPKSFLTITPPTSNSGLLFHEKINFLENALNLDSTKTLTLNPTLRSAPLSSIHSVLSFLSSHFHISLLDSTRIFQMYPHLLTCDPSTAFLPLYTFLVNHVKLSGYALRKSVLRCPRLLVSDIPTQLLPTFYFLKRIGITLNCNTTVLLVSSVEQTLIPKLEYIQSLGFSYNEAKKLAIRSPGMLTFSVEKNYKPKVEFLKGEMGRDVVKEVKEFPQYFSYSLDGRIRPRFWTLKERGLEGEMGLAEMLKVSEGEFTVRLLDMKLNGATM